MAALARRSSAHLPDLLDWLNAPGPSHWPFGAGTFRVEEYAKDGRYVIRAELPGLDPGKNIDITVQAGVLMIQAPRQEEYKERRSEFRYGSLARSVALPAGADLDHITATYDQRILEVSVQVAAEAEPKVRRSHPASPLNLACRQHGNVRGLAVR